MKLEKLSNEQAEVYGVWSFAEAMLGKLREKRATGEEKYKSFHRDEDHKLTPEAHDNWLKDWLKEKVDEENWVAVGNLAMMLYVRGKNEN